MDQLGMISSILGQGTGAASNIADMYAKYKANKDGVGMGAQGMTGMSSPSNVGNLPPSTSNNTQSSMMQGGLGGLGGGQGVGKLSDTAIPNLGELSSFQKPISKNKYSLNY